jgi:hypothetical protein
MKEDTRVTAVQRLLLRVALGGGVLVLLLIAFVAKFEFIETPSVLDHAVIARNLAEGRGLTHSVVRPLGLALAPEHPESVTFTAPLYPIILSVAVRLLGANGHVIVLVSVEFAALTLALMYVICMRFLKGRIAVASAGVMALTVPFIMHAVAGTEVTCLAFLITGLFGLLFAWRESSKQDSYWWSIAIAVVIALCWFIRYEMFALLPCVAVFWLFIDPKQWLRRTLWLVIVFAILTLPWVVRNSLLLHRPIVSASSYMLLYSTSLYPGDSILRAYEDVPGNPWSVITEHPGMILIKIQRHAMQDYSALPMLGNPYITALFLFGVLFATIRRRLAALHWALLAGTVLTAGILSCYVQSGSLLIAFAPMVAILGLVNFADTLRTASWPATNDEEDGSAFALRSRMWFQIIKEAGPEKLIIVGLVLLTLIVSFPMTDYLIVQPAAKGSPVVDGVRALGDWPYRLIMSDVPSVVAWYSGKRALLLPSDRWDLAAVERAGVIPDAIYLSASPQAGRAIFPGFRRVEDWRFPGVLLERLPDASRPALAPPDARRPDASQPVLSPLDENLPDDGRPAPAPPTSGD